MRPKVWPISVVGMCTCHGPSCFVVLLHPLNGNREQSRRVADVCYLIICFCGCLGESTTNGDEPAITEIVGDTVLAEDSAPMEGTEETPVPSHTPRGPVASHTPHAQWHPTLPRAQWHLALPRARWHLTLLVAQATMATPISEGTMPSGAQIRSQDVQENVQAINVDEAASAQFTGQVVSDGEVAPARGAAPAMGTIGIGDLQASSTGSSNSNSALMSALSHPLLPDDVLVKICRQNPVVTWVLTGGPDGCLRHLPAEASDSAKDIRYTCTVCVKENPGGKTMWKASTTQVNSISATCL